MRNLDNSLAKEFVFRKSMRDLFSEIGSFGLNDMRSKPMLREDEIELRAKFFREARGKFLKLFRSRREVSPETLGQAIGLSGPQIEAVESGVFPLTDPQFLTLCGFLGASQELGVFLEKIEEAFKPGLKEARRNLARPLEAYGIRFADPDKYQSEDGGKVLAFCKTPKRSDADT